jgi:class 3 adenylate cyclase/ketosteroid isomerase-like protein
VERSEEIRRVVQRFERAISDGDAPSVLGRLSTDPGLLVIGSDPAEWWVGSEARLVWERQLEEFQDEFRVTANRIEAFEEGTVGWASVHETIDWDGRTIDGRASYILHLEHGEWKVVQVHYSWPQRHVDVLGRSMTTTLEELEQSVQRARPDLSQSLDSEGTVTIAFTDIVDSTVWLSRLGDRAWRDLLRRHNAIIAEAVSAHGGRVVQTEGDGSMLAFASARRAVACAQEIQRRIAETFGPEPTPIRVRIGIHTGDALNEADGYFGRTVHYAARVASNAGGGEILVSSVVKELVAGPGLTFGEGRDVELKGLDGVHRLYAVQVA